MGYNVKVFLKPKISMLGKIHSCIILILLIPFFSFCQYAIKYRPDEQFYELGKGIEIEKPWIGKRQFLTNRKAEFTGSVTTQVNIGVVNSEADLYSIFNVSKDANFDYNFFKLEDKTFSSKSIHSKNNSLRIIIYARRNYSKASLQNDDDENLTLGAKQKLNEKKFDDFIQNYGNYYVSGVERAQVSAIALDFVNVEKDEIDKFKNDYGMTISFSKATISGSSSLETFIERKLKSSELNVQMFDFNKYDFQKDDKSAKILLGSSTGEFLTSVSALLETKLETFTFENAATTTFHLSPMSNFDIPKEKIPDILNVRLDDEGTLLFDLVANYNKLLEVSEARNFKMFQDESLIVELNRLKAIIKLLQQSFGSQTSSFIQKLKNNKAIQTSLKESLHYPNYIDSYFVSKEPFKINQDYINYGNYVGKVVNFFIDKYSQSPLNVLNFSKNYGNQSPFAITINKSIKLNVDRPSDIEYISNYANNDPALIFSNSFDRFDLPDKDYSLNFTFFMRCFDPNTTIGFYPKFKVDAIVLDAQRDYGTETIVAPVLSTTQFDNTYGSPANGQYTQEQWLSTINSQSGSKQLKSYFNRKNNLKLSGFNLTYLGHFDSNGVVQEPPTSPMPIVIQKFSISIEVL